uniref:Nuclear autoantigenic sperm protein n=1 Tax=Plectus sambesii TaxID=2011161 RepID=A0A914WA89_9BILA
MVADTNGENMIDSTSTAPEEMMTAEIEETTEQKTERAQTLFADGKRALAAGTLATANEKLSEACTLYTQLYDAFAVECFEPHMLYGKALLELSRLEPGVFSNALEGVAEEDESMNSGDEGEAEAEAETEKEAETATTAEETKAAADKTDEQFGNADELTEEQREEIQEQVEDALAENAEALDKGEMPPEDPEQAADATDDAKEPEGDEEAKDEELPEEGISAEEGAVGDEPPALET